MTNRDRQTLFVGIRSAARALVWGLLLVALVACSEAETPTAIEQCRDLLDDGLFVEAVAACPTDTDEGKSLSAQALMGRAGVSLLRLLEKLDNSTLEGEALIFSAFTVVVGSADFTDVDAAVDLFLLISTDANGNSNRTRSDEFNLTIASDVLLISLLKDHLTISVDDVTGVFTVPGVTDTGIDTLGATSTPAQIQTVFVNIYTNNGAVPFGGSYYTTTPLLWGPVPADANTDLSRVSKYVSANGAAAGALGLSTDPALASLAALDFSVKIDNGTCGYATGTTVGDAATAVLEFPRRLNTSHATANFLADELLFVDGATKEWQGSFLLPSALVNPDHMKVNCGAGLAVENFSACMAPGATKLIGTITALEERDSVTAIICGGTCNNFPLLGTDGNPGTDQSGALGTAAKDELLAVLDQLFPIDNTVTAPTGTRPAYACAAGDGLVHYREYDAYLRTLGQ